MDSTSNHASSPEKDYFKKINDKITPLLFFPYYQKHLQSMRRTLWFSRIPFLKSNGKYLLFLQKVMAIHLSRLQNTKNEGEKMLAQEPDTKKQEMLIKRINAHKELGRILQTIADGIAWRSMGYQRSLMRLFSENDPPGHIDKELGIITALKSSGIIIVNDLTRFCRIADFTRILPDGRIILYEAKTKVGRGRTIFKDMGDILKKVQGPGTPKLSRQDRRHVLTQKALISRKIEVPIFRENVFEKSLEVQIVDIDIPIKTHFRNLKQAIRIAKKNLWGCSMLEPGYFLSAKACDALKSMTKNPKEQIDKKWEERQSCAPEWVKNPSEDIVIFDTYFSFINEQNEFARNIIPYSVLPINNNDCIGLMSGHIRVKSYIDLRYFENRLKERGWRVERLKPDQLEGTETEREMFKKDFSDTLFKIEKKLDGGIYSTTISQTEVLHMMSSFYATDFILDAVEYRHNSAQLRSKGSQKISPQFPNEAQVLN